MSRRSDRIAKTPNGRWNMGILRRDEIRLRCRSLLLWLAVSAVAVGCRGPLGPQSPVDSTLQRHVKHANEAFSEGRMEQAIREYRKAVRRAWAMDDPYESGTAAYNLAASLLSDDRLTEAKDWLLDSRVELQRAGASLGNVWLLEAKIAQLELRFEDAYALVQRAACCPPPCSGDQVGMCGVPKGPCDEGCVARIPCLGSKVKRRRAERDCEAAYQAQIHLLRARLAAEQYDIPLAQRELAIACDLAADVCSHDLQAEMHDVAALIHIAKGEYLQAGRHLDREAEELRLAGNYREIAGTLELASAAYEQAGLTALASDRLCRVARIVYGRGEVDRAWSLVQSAVPMAEAACSETASIRLALLANEILLVLSEQGDPPPATSSPTEEGLEQEEDLGMLAPASF